SILYLGHIIKLTCFYNRLALDQIPDMKKVGFMKTDLGVVFLLVYHKTLLMYIIMTNYINV
ncbi:hypothetical protein ACJX0J_034596, partial [Zea mays]